MALITAIKETTAPIFRNVLLHRFAIPDPHNGTSFLGNGFALYPQEATYLWVVPRNDVLANVTFSCPIGTTTLYSIDGSEPDQIWDGVPIQLTGGTRIIRVICQNQDCTTNVEENVVITIDSLIIDPILLD